MQEGGGNTSQTGLWLTCNAVKVQGCFDEIKDVAYVNGLK